MFKALLFLGAGAVIHAVGSNDLSRMGGLVRRMPQTAIVFIVGTLSLAGIPLFGGFLSKEEILGAVWAGGLVGPFALLMLVAFLTAFYMFRVVFLAFFGHGPAQAGPADAGPAKAGHYEHRLRCTTAHTSTILLPRCFCRCGFSRCSSMAVGIYFTFEHGEPEFASPGWLTPAAVGVAVAGIALAWLTYQRGAINPATLASLFGPIRRAALAKFWIDDFFEGVVAAGHTRLLAARLAGSTATWWTACSTSSARGR